MDDSARRRLGGLWIATVGLALFPLTAIGLVTRLEVPVGEALLLAVLAELLPFLAVAQVPLAEGARLQRIPAYLGSASLIVVLGGLSLLLAWTGGGVRRLGLGSISAGDLALWSVLLVVAAGALIGGFWIAGRLLGIGETDLLTQLLPVTGGERWAFGALSVVAGFGEEIAFRGFSMATASPFMGVGGAAALTSLAFGALHAYQGGLGVIRTASIGMLLATSWVVLESLWPAIVAHIVIDLVGGLWIGPRFLVHPDAAELA